MRPDRRLLLVVAIVLVGSAPVAHGASQEAQVTPSDATPGQILLLTFNTPSPGLLDAAVQRSATCTITGPEGTPVATCTTNATLLVARVSPASASYAWSASAPNAPGNYTVTFQETNLVSLMPAPSAQTHFTVAPKTSPAGEPLQSGGTTSGALETGEPMAAAWLVSVVTGSGSLVLLLLAHRPGV